MRERLVESITGEEGAEEEGEGPEKKEGAEDCRGGPPAGAHYRSSAKRPEKELGYV